LAAVGLLDQLGLVEVAGAEYGLQAGGLGLDAAFAAGSAQQRL
jgi:hypothetical protein